MPNDLNERYDILRRSHWSDRFFNWDDYNESIGRKENAKKFLQQNPNCPFDVNWLIRDHQSRT